MPMNEFLAELRKPLKVLAIVLLRRTGLVGFAGSWLVLYGIIVVGQSCNSVEGQASQDAAELRT